MAAWIISVEAYEETREHGFYVMYVIVIQLKYSKLYIYVAVCIL